MGACHLVVAQLMTARKIGIGIVEPILPAAPIGLNPILEHIVALAFGIARIPKFDSHKQYLLDKIVGWNTLLIINGLGHHRNGVFHRTRWKAAQKNIRRHINNVTCPAINAVAIAVPIHDFEGGIIQVRGHIGDRAIEPIATANRYNRIVAAKRYPNRAFLFDIILDARLYFILGVGTGIVGFDPLNRNRFSGNAFLVLPVNQRLIRVKHELGGNQKILNIALRRRRLSRCHVIPHLQQRFGIHNIIQHKRLEQRVNPVIVNASNNPFALIQQDTQPYPCTKRYAAGRRHIIHGIDAHHGDMIPAKHHGIHQAGCFAAQRRRLGVSGGVRRHEFRRRRR